MVIYLIGAGCGTGTLTQEAAEAINSAKYLIGAERLLGIFPDTFYKTAAVLPEKILEEIRRIERDRTASSAEEEAVCVLFSGDSGFYSGTKRLLPLLEEYSVRVFPGISSLQLFAARCGRPWQDWNLCSAHGADCDAVREVCKGKPVFFLTGGKLGPAQLCAQLKEAGLEDLKVTVGQDLGTEKESVISGTAGSYSDKEFAPLSVMLAEAAPRPIRRSSGLPDDAFERTEHVPMTKQFVRAAIMAKLAPGQDDVCWDVGTGSGSVAIEMALQAGAVYSVERNPEARELAGRNRAALGAWNLRLKEGSASGVLKDLPAPDAVFIGGSGGTLREILALVQEKNKNARVCISAVTLETLSDAVCVLEEFGYETDVVQIGISLSRKVGKKGNGKKTSLHMMTAQNPIWLVTGEYL